MQPLSRAGMVTAVPSAVTSRLQSPASAPVQRRALDFTAVPFTTGRQTAYFRAWRRTRAHSNALGEHRNFPLAKVGVEGSNPFARSN